MFTDTQMEAIAQAAADGAYNAVHSLLAAHTAPGVQIVETAAPAAPALTFPQATPQAAQATGTGWEAADAYAAYRLHTGMDQATWKAVDTAAKAAIRAAQVAPFDRHTQRKDAQAAAAAFGQVAAAPVAQAAQAAPQAAARVATLLDLMGTTLQDAPMAAAKAAKVQPAGTVALNALKRFAKAHGLQIPTRGSDVSPGTWAAVVAHVEGERAAGHVVTTDTVCVWLSAQTGR